MKIERVQDSRQVRNFLLDAGSSLNAFRYYARRDIDAALSRHIDTRVGYDAAGAPIAYGHLDYEDGRVWLGVCVIEDCVGRRYGSDMVRQLLAVADSREISAVHLAVDSSNVRARRLYERFGFVVEHEGEPVIMRRDKTVADTLGSLIDKLATCNQKMFLNQELLYEIRRMSFDEYKAKFFESEDGAKRLWETLKKACDLNVQRNALMSEVDEKVVEIAQAAARGEELDNGSFIQRQHKTY